MFVIRASGGYLAQRPGVVPHKWDWTGNLQKATVFADGNALVALLWQMEPSYSEFAFARSWEFVEVTQDCVPAYADRTIKPTGVVKN